MNSLQWPRKEVVKIPGEYSGKDLLGVVQRTEAGEQYALVDAPPMGSSPVLASTPSRDVTISMLILD